MHRSLKALALAVAAALVGCPTGPADPEPIAFELVTGAYEDGALFCLWGSGASDVWTVGGEAGQPVVLHFNGTAWTREDPPLAQQLWWVHGFAQGPLFVVGDGGALARRDTSGVWQVFDEGYTGTTFYGVWGAAPDDVWAVGGPYRGADAAEQEGDVVLHFDGVAWERVSIPALEGKPASAQTELFKVWGASSDDVFIVGASGEALHYDGAAWRLEPTGIGNEPLFTVWGRSANDVYAVGGFGRGVLLHWDGSAWSAIELPLDAPSVLQGLWTAPGEPVHVSGWYGFLGAYENGAWLVSEPPTNYALHGVWGDGNAVWAAGGSIETFSPNYVGVIAVSGVEVPAL